MALWLTGASAIYTVSQDKVLQIQRAIDLERAGDPTAASTLFALRKELGGAKFDGIYDTLEDGNLRVIDNAEAAKIKGRGAIPNPPSEMSDNLVNIRSTLNDPRAVEAFDEMFGKMRGNSANMERAVEGIRKKGTDLEESMLSKWEKANRTAFGAAVKQIPDALTRGQKLRDEVQAFKDANPQIKGISEWFDRIDGELKNLNQMQRGKKEAKPETIQGYLNNFNGVEAEFRYAQKQPGVTGVGQKFKYADDTGKIRKTDVDVVADNGNTWIDNKNVKPFGLESSTWKGDLTKEKQGLKTQAENLLKSAQQNPNNGVTPKVVIEFPKGVSREVAQELQNMRIEVRGTIVDIS